MFGCRVRAGRAGPLARRGRWRGAHYLATGKLEVLSEQQMVDCDHEVFTGRKLLLIK